MKKNNTHLDPISVSVIHGAIQSIAIEMGYKLMRMSYSSIIRESEDFGAALTDSKGYQIAESTQSTPLQSGPIPGYIQNVIKVFKSRNEQFLSGDVILHNDPYGGASHGPDFAVIVPIFYSRKLVGFAGTTAHHLDVGALSPGSCGIVDAMDVFAEGLQFKAIKLYEKGIKNNAAWQIIEDNVRAPLLVIGDMNAQVSACQIGKKRFLEIIDIHSLTRVQNACYQQMKYSETMMRKAIQEVPDGKYKATTCIDGYLESGDKDKRNLPIVVEITVKDDTLVVDLSGTAKQVDDRPINLPFIGTVDIAIWLTIRSVLLDSEIYGEIPLNSGLTRPITIKAPLGCLANPKFPAPVIARFAPGNQLADTVMKALSLAVPKKVSAGIGNLKVIAFSGIEKKSHWVHMEIFEGSYGGRLSKDGMDSVDTLYANTRNNPIEDIETHLPIRIEKYELRENSSGAGTTRGGLGSIRSFKFLKNGGFSVEGEGHKYPPWGFKGGSPGSTAQLILKKSDGSTETLPSKVPYRQIKKNESVVAIGPCSGGYGEPLLRNPNKVFDDILDELISSEIAKQEYGVIVVDGKLDLELTKKLRNFLLSKKKKDN